MPYDDVVDTMPLGKAHNLLGGMAHGDVDVRLEWLVRELCLHTPQHILVVLPGLFNQSLRLNRAAKLWRSHDGQHVNRGAESPCQLGAERQCLNRRIGTIVGHQQILDHDTLPVLTGATAAVFPDSASSSFFSKCLGRKKAFAISVGTTALATTAATTAEY